MSVLNNHIHHLIITYSQVILFLILEMYIMIFIFKVHFESVHIYVKIYMLY